MDYNLRGQELPDPTPVELPIGVSRPLTLQQEIQRLVRLQVSQAAAAEGEETFEEADDFEVDEDPDLFSPYEVVEGVVEAPGGVKDEDASPPPDPNGKPAGEPPGAS